MEDLKKLALAKLTADICNGKFISSKRQIKNGTFVFSFPQKEDKIYAVYASGYVRCMPATKSPFWATPLLFDKNRNVKKVSHEEGFSYLIGRFGNK